MKKRKGRRWQPVDDEHDEKIGPHAFIVPVQSPVTEVLAVFDSNVSVLLGYRGHRMTEEK